MGDLHISATVTIREDLTSFLLTTVYGPARHNRKQAFLQDMRNLKPSLGTQWLILGDFNLIYKASDKNNGNLNRQLMGQFRDALDECDLREINLQNRKYTWSNERRNPTLAKLDRVFCNAEWDTAFDTHVLHALSTSLSDHCPILLSNRNSPRRPQSFKFENYWTKLPGFLETVQSIWNKPPEHHEPFHRLYHKLGATAKALRAWSKSIISDVKMQLEMATVVIHQLDIAQERRQLLQEELLLRKRLKNRVLGLAAIERARKKQTSRLTNLKLGDANTRYFQRRANARRRKNHIQRLRKEHGWAVTHEEKAGTIQDHLTEMLKRPPLRTADLNWAALGLTRHDLSDLGMPFTEEEIKRAINQMPFRQSTGAGWIQRGFPQSMLAHHKGRHHGCR
jgi:hypothetical protein